MLFLWHCCEELEHKAVVADAFAALGGGELRRMASYVLASVVLEAATLAVAGALAAQLPRVPGRDEWVKRGKGRGVAAAARREVGTVPALHWSVFKQCLKPGFHPGDVVTAPITVAGFRA